MLQQRTLEQSLKIKRAIEVNAIASEGQRWYDSTERYLLSHITYVHLSPGLLFLIGIPRFDIEVAEYRGVRLDSAASYIYGRLKTSDYAIEQEIDEAYRHYNNRPDVNALRYKELLVKTLLLMEQKRLARIDWDTVEHNFPGARKVTLDVERDSNDASFYDAMAHEIQLHRLGFLQISPIEVALARIQFLRTDENYNRTIISYLKKDDFSIRNQIALKESLLTTKILRNEKSYEPKISTLILKELERQIYPGKGSHFSERRGYLH